MYAGMAEGGRDPDDWEAELADEPSWTTFVDLTQIRQNLPLVPPPCYTASQTNAQPPESEEQDASPPRCQHKRNVRAGRKVRMARERAEREWLERERRRRGQDATTGAETSLLGAGQSSDREATSTPVPATMRPILQPEDVQRKIARIPVLSRLPGRGRGATLVPILQPTTQFPLYWNHLNGRPIGALCPDELTVNYEQVHG